MSLLPYFIGTITTISFIAFLVVLFPLRREQSEQHDSWLNFLAGVKGDNK